MNKRDGRCKHPNAGTWSLLVRDVWDSVRAGPARAGLSVLAVTVGIGALVVLQAVLGGLRERARQLVHELGGNVLAIEVPTKKSTASAALLNRADRVVLESAIPGARVSCVRRYEVEEARGRVITVLETDEHLADVRGWDIARGRFLDSADVERGERVAVISEDVSMEWAVDVGEVVRLQGHPYVVVGVVSSGGGAGSAGESSQRLFGEKTVAIPYSSYNPWQPTTRPEVMQVDALYARLPAGFMVEDWVPVTARLLGASERKVEEWSWITPQRLVAGIRKTQRAIRWAGGSIAVLCLILGGTTLMSLMVANVRERVAEIGLRRALGATARDIAMLFVVEAWLIMSCASLAGLVLASLVLAVIRNQLPVPFFLTGVDLVVPFIVALAMGTLFSYWPAMMAARISPAEALRND